ncbi:MAG: hypothetical protein ACKOQ0_04145, partial [Solirubrobacterales bacterium]
MRRLVLIAAGLALLVAAPVASAATRAGGAWQAVAPEGGALDLSAVSFGQDERELVFRAKSRQPITHSLLSSSGGGEICLAVDPRSGNPRRVCL